MSGLSDLRMQAIAQHEIVLSYIAAGFTRAESIDLLKTHINAGAKSEGNTP